MKRFVPTLLLAVAASGCLGTTNPNDGATTCTITIVGATAIAGTYTCPSRAVAVWTPNNNVGLVAVNISGTKSITGVFAFPGEPRTGVTFRTETSPANLQSFGFLVAVDKATWEFSAGQSKTLLGNGSLTFSSVAALPAQTGGTTYIVHGAIDGNLVPSPRTPATGNATIHVDF